MLQWQHARRYLVNISIDLPKHHGNRPPLTNEFRIDMARFEIPVSGWTCLRTNFLSSVLALQRDHIRSVDMANCTTTVERTFIDVGGVSFLPSLSTLLLVTGRSCCLLACLFLFSRCLSGWGLAASGWLLLGSFGRHFGQKGTQCTTW